MKDDFLVIGHRGCAGVLPENTLGGVRRAVEVGCRMVEVDVWLCEGRLVVIHDETVDRTTDGVGRVEDFFLNDLRDLDAGGGERIPFLEDVLNICLGRCSVNVELKGVGTGEVVVELLEGRGGVDDVLVSSFDWRMLREVRGLDGGVSIGVLLEGGELLGEALVVAGELGAVAVNVWVGSLDVGMVGRIHGGGFLCFVFTVRTEVELVKVRECGADGCFADDPGGGYFCW